MPKGIHRVFESFLGQLVSSKVIPFAMRDGSGGVSMLCQIVKFGSSIMATLRHCVLPGDLMRTQTARSLPEGHRGRHFGGELETLGAFAKQMEP